MPNPNTGGGGGSVTGGGGQMGGGSGGGLGGGDGGGTATDGGEVDGGPIGTGESVTRTVGPAGGTLSVGCHTLTVPAGALGSDVIVKLTITTQSPPMGYQTYSPVVRLEPAATVLATPATLALCFAGNSQLATVFQSRVSGGGFERFGGLVTGTTIATPINRFGDAFVANGVSYQDPPDRSCARLSLLDTRTGAVDAGTLPLPDGGMGNLSSSVALVFRAEDCSGRPLVGLTEADFVIKEDEATLSVEANKRILPAKGLQVYVSLVLDLSSSTRPHVTSLIDAAKAFVSQSQSGTLRVPISIRLFAGDAISEEWEAPTLDTAKLLQRLDAVASSYSPTDPNSTNLYGAVIDAVTRSTAVQASFRQRNAGGAFTAGYIILFTDGQDTTGLQTKAAALAAINGAKDSVLAVALDTGDFTTAAELALNELTSGDPLNGRNVVVSTDPARLNADFGAIANRIAGLSTGSYLLGYCSPKRAGSHTVAIEVANAMTQPRIEHTFSAAGFIPGCSSDVFEAVCSNKDCGGLACGSCDDRTSRCVASTSRCESNCKGPPLICGGTSITNAQGYLQTCSDSREATFCGAACQNVDTDLSHCGQCGNRCASGSSCTLGVCACPAGQIACLGVCVDLQTDPRSCGMCGNTCSGPVCLGGTCTSVVQLAAGGANTCARISDGTVRCWGPNSFGQLGDGTNTARPGPTTVLGVTAAQGLSVSTTNACSTLADGTLQCWGAGHGFQPVAVPGVSEVQAVSVSGTHTCTLTADAGVQCFGSNNFGQLGDGTTTTRASPVPVVGLPAAVGIVAGNSVTCALMRDQTVQCWGALGDGSATVRSTPEPVSNLTAVSQLSLKNEHACAVHGGGSISCWGAGLSGQLGNGSSMNQLLPVAVQGIANAVQVVTGNFHSCARLSDSTVKCWGINTMGQLGDGSFLLRPTPVVALGLTGVLELVAGSNHTCARLAGAIRCWGNNDNGEWGDRGGDLITRPTPLASPLAVSQVAIGAVAQSASNFPHHCARLLDGSLRCWGGNNAGQRGDGTLISSSVSTPVMGVTSVLGVSVGFRHSCAVLSDRTAVCWGFNSSGQLGDGTQIERLAPVPVTGLTGVEEIVAGQSHSCARLTSGAVRCWGNASSGQVGNGNIFALALTPVPVLGVISATKLSAAISFNCVVEGGGVKCWGDNNQGQLGDGTIVNRSTPVSVPGIVGATTVSTSQNHTCAVVGSVLRCWGANNTGQLGTGATSPNEVSPVGSQTNVAESALGLGFSCVRRVSGQVQCWGSNGSGQLGNGTRTPSLTPVGTLTDVASLTARAVSVCAVMTDAGVTCWGANEHNLLGLSTGLVTW